MSTTDDGAAEVAFDATRPTIKPCPFCGSGAPCLNETGVFWLSCDTCSCEGPTGQSEREARNLWNQAARPAPVEPAGDPVRDGGAVDRILEGLHAELEAGASGKRVREIAEAYPEARADILAFAAEWCAHSPAPPAPTADRAPETARELLARADMLLHDAEGDDESMAHGLVHDAAAFLSDREEVRADVRTQYAKSEPPHGHQAPPAAACDHVWRGSDASTFDAVCTKCGITDTQKERRRQAPPAAPVGGVTEAEVEAAFDKIELKPVFEYGDDTPSGFEIDRNSVRAALEAAFAARLTPEDGCPKSDSDCLGGNGDCHDACSTFAERGAVEAAVAAERERCAAIAARHGALDVCIAAIRSRASTPAVIDGLAPGGRDGTEG